MVKDYNKELYTQSFFFFWRIIIYFYDYIVESKSFDCFCFLAQPKKKIFFIHFFDID